MRRSILYKLIITINVVLFTLGYCLAQDVLPRVYPSNKNVSYVRTWDVTSPQTSPDTVMVKPLKDVKQTTLYVDGLGRPIQAVIKQGSMVTDGTAYDLVSANTYDEFGREAL